MKKLFLLIGLVVFLNATNLFAKEKDEEPIDIEDVKKPISSDHPPLANLPCDHSITQRTLTYSNHLA